MKRIILPLILCAIFATYLYADLNPFAYGLSSSLSLDDATLTVNYSLKPHKVFIFDKKNKENAVETHTDKKEKKDFFLYASVGVGFCALIWLANLL